MGRKHLFREKKELTDEELREKYYPVSSNTGKRYRKSVSFRVRENESLTLLRWIEAQTNFTESIRYLIEKQILEDGEIVDLSKPRDLDELLREKMKTQISHEEIAATAKKEPVENTYTKTGKTEIIQSSPVQTKYDQEIKVNIGTKVKEEPKNNQNNKDIQNLAESWA